MKKSQLTLIVVKLVRRISIQKLVYFDNIGIGLIP